MNTSRCAILLVVLAACLGADTLDPPVYVEVYLRATTARPRDEKLVGDLVACNEEGISIRPRGGSERRLRWTDLTSSSAFVVKSRLIDRNDARAWLELGRFGWSMNAKEQARSALAMATKLDPALKSDAQAILASVPGDALANAAPAATAPAATAPAEADANQQRAPSAGDSKPGSASGEAAANIGPAQSGKRVGRDKLQKYQKSTPELDAAALARARRTADAVSKKLQISFTELQTEHFILFTDWDPREFGFLKDNLEGAYAVVSRQFEIPVKENVFVGKLPVFMFGKQADFKTFARDVDGLPAGDGVAGYFATRGDSGVGHMAMWKPDVAAAGGDRAAAERQWAYVLTHEFTHAFIARYRSNENVPRWLNEGVAEVIANSKFPRPTSRTWARTIAASSTDFSILFDDEQMPGGEMYPVMMTMVETLIVRDRRAFLAYFDDLKTGEDPDVALKKHFGLDQQGLIKLWKNQVMSKG